MTNADKFKNIFGLYATELWSMPEKDFLKWLNSEAVNCSEIPNNCPAADVVPVVRCKDCKFREEDAFCTGRGFPCQLVPDDGFCDKGKKNKNYNTLTRKQRKAD